MAEALPLIEGLNTRAALARVGGDQTTYRKLLRRFFEQANVPSEVLERSATDDWREAERLAHTLKGLAGNLGAESIQRAAEELETAVRLQFDAGELGRLAEECQGMLADFLDRLAKGLGPDPEPSNSPLAATHEPLEQRRILLELDRLLGEFDAEATELFEIHRSLLLARLSEDEFARFEHQLANYAFGEAREVLREAQTNRDIDWP